MSEAFGIGPCPFCGSDETYTYVNTTENILTVFVLCDNCGAQGPLCESPSEASRKWNEVSLSVTKEWKRDFVEMPLNIPFLVFTRWGDVVSAEVLETDAGGNVVTLETVESSNLLSVDRCLYWKPITGYRAMTARYMRSGFGKDSGEE